MKRILVPLFAAVLATALAACASAPIDQSAPKAEQQSASAQPVQEVDAYNITKVASSATVDLHISNATMTLGGKTFARYLYVAAGDDASYGAGLPIVVDAGDTVRLSATNDTDTTTNIHWHGMNVPNDQDGPGILIKPGQTHDYEFKAEEAGTYWYHSHERPVRDQVDEGMYAPIIVRDPVDASYDLDQILVLDDWLVGGNTGRMEIVGDVDTVNGRSGQGIAPIGLKAGQIAKLRLINASTARTQEMTFPVDVRVTHTDGAPLVEPVVTRQLSIAPGERYDVELAPTGQEGADLQITNERDAGMVIPVEITGGPALAAASPYQAPAPQPLDPALAKRSPDVEMTLSDGMGMGGHAWAINGKVFPDTDMYSMKRGQTYVIRFRNEGMHRMAHPMHIHGAHFRVLSLNGKPMSAEVWKDTMNIPHGEYVDVAVTFDKPGTWMVHCHILDHEDGGMMTMIEVS